MTRCECGRLCMGGKCTACINRPPKCADCGEKERRSGSLYCGDCFDRRLTAWKEGK